MTAQARDSIQVDSTSYDICGIKGTGWFNPSEHGLSPYGVESCLWRGYQCNFAIKTRLLFLTTLSIALHPDDPLVLGGSNEIRLLDEVLRRTPPSQYYDGYRLDLFLPFTGSLLLGRDSLPRGPFSDFPPLAWQFLVVYEIQLSEGYLTAAKNLSAVMDAARAVDPHPKCNSYGPGDYRDWVANKLNLGYSMTHS
jgi:hypothetical protein